MAVSMGELRQHIGYHTAWWRVSSPTAHRRSPSASRPAYRLASVPTLQHWSLRPVHCYTGHSVQSTPTLVTPFCPLLPWSLRSVQTATLLTPFCPLLHWSLRSVQTATVLTPFCPLLHSSLRSVHCNKQLQLHPSLHLQADENNNVSYVTQAVLLANWGHSGWW